MPSSRSVKRGRSRSRSAQRGRTRSRGQSRSAQKSAQRGRTRSRGQSRSAQRGRTRSMHGGFPLRGGRGGSYGSANMYGGPTMDSSFSSLGSAPFHPTISIMKSQQGGTGNMAPQKAFNYSPLSRALNAA